VLVAQAAIADEAGMHGLALPSGRCRRQVSTQEVQ